MNKFKALIMSLLAISSIPIKDGKVNFSDDQKDKLNSEFGNLGPDFIAKFEEAMNAEIENKSAQEKADSLQAMLDSVKAESKKQIDALAVKLEEATKKAGTLSEKVDALVKKSEDDLTPENENPTGKVVKFKANMKHRHNMRAMGYVSGKENLEIAATTIDVSEMTSEFGDFMSQFDISLEVIKKLTQKTVTEKYMTTKLAIESWRASSALISSVVQQFTAKWTPLGQSTFTPITIQNYRHKINVPITPDEIMDSWLAYLYDETKTPEEMPITKYIIEQLIIPKVLDDRELRLIGKGVFESLGAVTEGDPGQATGKSMNGFCTILKTEKASGTSAINFIDLGTITDANIVDKMNEFVDNIDELYQGIPMPIFCSATRYKQYKRAYKKLYGSDSPDPQFGNDVIDFSVNRLVALPSMSGEDLFFATPKENFIRLQHKNAGASKIFMQTENYDVKVFAEWWEGVGFAIGEAVFAYVPDADSESGS